MRPGRSGGAQIDVGGGIAEDSNIVVKYDEPAGTREVVISGSTAVEGSLRYIARNPVGKQIDYFWPWVKITPNGDFALKGDEWQQIPFTIEVLRRSGYEAVYSTTRAAA